jgi:hypothetical protein
MTVQTILDALSRCPEHAAIVAKVMYAKRVKWEMPTILSQIDIFHAASVWLPGLQVNIMVTRIVFFAPWNNFRPTWAGPSLLLAKIFDQNWVVSPLMLRIPIVSPFGLIHRNLTFPFL